MKSEPVAGPLESGSDDYDGNATTTGVLAPNGSVTGVIEASGDVDWFAVTFVADEMLPITTPLRIVALILH